MREVAVIGIGQTKVDEHWDKSLRDLAGIAALAALADSGLQKVEAVYVGNMMSGSANRQQHLGAYIADWIGMRGRGSVSRRSGMQFRRSKLSISRNGSIFRGCRERPCGWGGKNDRFPAE